MERWGERLLGFLESRQLLPVPDERRLSSQWDRHSFPQMMRDYVSLHMSILAEMQELAGRQNPEFWVYLDPSDLLIPFSVSNHVLLADRLVTPDPLTMLPSEPGPPVAWIGQLRRALELISSHADWIRSDFLAMVPGPKLCGVGDQVMGRIQATMRDPAMVRPWLRFGVVQRPERAASIAAQGRTFSVPMTAFHWNGRFLHAALDMDQAKELDGMMKDGTAGTLNVQDAVLLLLEPEFSCARVSIARGESDVPKTAKAL